MLNEILPKGNFHKIRIDHLITFQSLAQTRNFTQTAEFLGKSQSTISQRLRELELSLGNCILINRTSKTFHLTHSGRLVLEWINTTFNNLIHLQEKLTQQKNLQQIKIIIPSSSIPGEYILPKLFMEFKSLHPHLQFEIKISNTEKSISQLMKEDASFCAIGSLDHVDIRIIEHKIIGHDTIEIIARKDHPIFKEINSRSKSGNLSQIQEILQKYPWVFREDGSATRKLFLDNYPAVSRLNLGLEFQNNTAIIQAVENSNALSIMSSYMLNSLSNHTNIQVLNYDGHPKIQRYLYLIRKKNKEMSPIERQFWESIEISFTNIVE